MLNSGLPQKRLFFVGCAVYCSLALLGATFSINARAAADKPHPMLPTTPKYTCEQLLRGAPHGKPAGRFGMSLFRRLVGRRYATEIKGLPEILDTGKEGILFLPNHSGPIDPVIVLAAIGQDTNVRPVMTEEMVKGAAGPVLKRLVGGVNAILLPSPSVGGKTGATLAKSVLDETGNAINHGDNILLYPSGAIQVSSREKIVSSNSAVHQLLKSSPNVRIVLVRERGIWGSSWTHGAEASDPAKKLTTGQIIPRGLVTGIKTLLANGFFLTPKRPVVLEFFEPADFPRNGTREEINAYLENFYNSGAPEKRTFVRQYFWQLGRKKVRVSETEIDYGVKGKGQEVTVDLPELDAKIGAKLIELTKGIFNTTDLDLNTNIQEAGLDSLNHAELMAAINESYNVTIPDGAEFANLAELSQLVAGEIGKGESSKSNMQASAGWLANPSSDKPVVALPGETVTEIVIKKAMSEPSKVVGEDQIRGPITYKDLLLKSVAMASIFEKLPGQRLGILLPASGGGPLVYMASHLAGKVPQYVPFTSTPESIVTFLDSIGVQKIITSRKVFETLAKDYDMSRYMERFIFLEDLITKIKFAAPMALLKIKLFPKSILKMARRTKDAVILATSGSSGLPKAVPLSHANILANVKDITELFKVTGRDRLLSFLPPFHSFGHMMQVLSLELGVPAVYHPKPTDAQTLADLIGAYKPTIVAGTPAFLEELARRKGSRDFSSIRLIFAGAAKLQDSQIALLKTTFPNADILEGYGLTETSPVLAVNPPGAAKFGTVGRMLKSIKYVIVDPDTFKPVTRGQKGQLLVAGPSVFEGYINTGDKQPFVTVDGFKYFDTEDIVSEDADGYLTIHGRKGRDRKKQAQKFNLNDIEVVLDPWLESQRPKGADREPIGGPLFVVESAGDDLPSVLFTRVPVTLEQVQRFQRDKGVTGVQMIDQVRIVDDIPLLGPGKIDYKIFNSLLKAEAAR